MKKYNLDFLTPQERDLLEEAIGYENLSSNHDNGLGGVAEYSLETECGYVLWFEGDIEDDGACISLRTPYDHRDGKFFDFSNCVTESW